MPAGSDVKCDAWLDAKGADYVVTDADKLTLSWAQACYMGAVNLTAFGAAAVAAIATLAF